MIAVAGIDRDLGQHFLAVAEVAVVRDPFLPKNLGGPGLVHLPGMRPSRVPEGVRRRPKAHHGLAGLRIPDDVLELVVRQHSKPGEHHHQIGIVKRLEPRNVLQVVRVDNAIFVESVTHGDLEAVIVMENPGQHWHRFLAAILLVAGHEDDMWRSDLGLGQGNDFAA